MRNKWFIAYKKRGEDLFNTEGFTIIEPPSGTYQADPFPYVKDGKRYLFIEDYDYKTGKLSVYDIGEDGIPTTLTPVIENSYHFSYPFIFEYKDDLWIIPETGRNGGIELYRCEEFPYTWTRVKTLITAPGADSTLFERDGRLWMFTTLSDDYDTTIFYADDLLGEWTLHSRNRHQHSRPAGNLFYYEDKLIRPTQDCSQCYGHALVFKEIELNNAEYTEKVYKRIEPTWHPGIIGTHTFNFDDDYVYIDGKIQVND